MRFAEAEGRIGDVRQWSTREWEWHDVTAETYRQSHPEPTAEYQHAVKEVDDAAGRNYPRAEDAKRFIAGLNQTLDRALRATFDREGEHPEDEEIQKLWRYAHQAIRDAVAADLADGWITPAEASALTAAYRAPDEKLQFSFSIQTTSPDQAEVLDAFTDAVRTEYDSTTVDSDPEHQTARQFRIGGFAYEPGAPAAAGQTLEAALRALLAGHDPQNLIDWPPADFHTQRPNRG